MVHHFRAVFSLLTALSLAACTNTVEVVGEPSTEGSNSVVKGGKSPSSSGAQNNDSQAVCASYEGTGCYWMESTSGNYCWIPADWGLSIEACFDLDSCAGGLSESGGGCYKWADGSDAERYPWP